MINLGFFLLVFWSMPFQAISWDPNTPFPSCLVTGVTWDPHGVLDYVQEVLSPESCQLICSENADCEGFSWISKDIDLLVANVCVLFSKTEEEIKHENIVSGPPSCPCTMTGGCVVDDLNHNVIDAIQDIADEGQCNDICADNAECKAFTFVGEGHVFSHFCVLYNSCAEVDPGCTECTTGVPDCQHCSFQQTFGEQCIKCESNADLLSIAPAVQGYSSRMVLCDDPLDQTCEQDQVTLCPQGFHLCTYPEFITLNDEWNVSISATQRPVGEIYCRAKTGAGHFTLGSLYPYPYPISLDYDEPRNCWYGSVRPQCPEYQHECNEKHVSALCCSSSLSCGNGVVDNPLEECDDGNNNDDDGCLSTCTFRTPGSDAGDNC